MHQLKVLILGPSSFSSTLNELTSFLKFIPIYNNQSSNIDLILFHEDALNVKELSHEFEHNSNILRYLTNKIEESDVLESKEENVVVNNSNETKVEDKKEEVVKENNESDNNETTDNTNDESDNNETTDNTNDESDKGEE